MSMSSSQIDPRLRDAAPPPGAFAQRLSSATTSVISPIAANPPPTHSLSHSHSHSHSQSQSQSQSPSLPQHHQQQLQLQQQLQQQHQQQQYPPLQDAAHYLPQTPQSAGRAMSMSMSDNDGGNPALDGSQLDSKRPRACEACRGLKVRCESDMNIPDGPCKRCAKAGRNCVVTVPSRKRQKKTDSRVAELEKKIDALTASLQATKSASVSVAPGGQHGVAQDGPDVQVGQNPYQQVTNGVYNTPFVNRSEVRLNSTEYAGYPKEEFDSKRMSAPPMVVAGQKRKHADSRDEYSGITMSTGNIPKRLSESGTGQHLCGPNEAMSGTAPQKQALTHEYADVVDRGLLTADMATKIFNSYVEKMAPHLPAVVFPADTTAAEVRKSKPTLFLAILSASSGMNYPELQRTLTKEVMSIYAERIIVNGEKTLELIQALHVSTLWYWPPEHFEELKFYQLIHIAAVMAIDIGMGKKSKPQKAKYHGLWKDHPWRRTPYPDSESPEARRAWLACYFLCCNASMGLRRPNLIRWTSFMADCIEFLETSPDAAPSDKVLCQWVRSQHMAEEVGTQFSMDDPMANVSIADSKVQYALKGFERDLDKWSSQIPAECHSVDLKLTEHVVNLYMHEVAMHVDHNVEEFKPPFTEENLRGVGEREPDMLTSAHINALSTCLTSIDGILENFFKFDTETVRCLPIFNFIRVAYAVVVLIKMYFAAATPNSELGNVINKDNMKVEQYLDMLLEIFKAAAAEEKSRPAAKFLMVLIMLKTWFHRQREGKTAQPGDAVPTSTLLTEWSSDTPNDPNSKGNRQDVKPQNGQRPFTPANTPLQLLSEVATGDSRGQSRSENGGQYSGTPSEWQQSQQFANYESMNQVSSVQNNYPIASGNIDPALGMDLGYTMGDGFEQALGMTLGVGDYAGYFGDDVFFGNLMDTMGSNMTNTDGF
ncbi:Zn2 DNA-binding protein [Venustampulla echinocandica]|uniref:Zn2 DNA-binding protein n=1 Tax=Venustampulla echinocandica TaxID=2656787 RepID=A0A370TMQ8_9HELO|nr:Zn2 DNA-binding protein [Venustampulla echinocandica]RDL36804.1 Zn2 DNA-binding protein [Venustampulla echinocandica]